MTRSKEMLISAAKARGGRRCHHAASRSNEEALAEPRLQRGNLPADGAMG
jgi:hypothetical protein